ncbi:hypothetical protein E4U21_002559 [Claviceps maximensis]|nr:hypothetical protein E4U21_002559 [Claviceps maximensis]
MADSRAFPQPDIRSGFRPVKDEPCKNESTQVDRLGNSVDGEEDLASVWSSRAEYTVGGTSETSTHMFVGSIRQDDPRPHPIIATP